MTISHDQRLGIDLGGTKIEGILLDRNGAVLNRLRIPTPQQDYDAIITAVSGLVHQLTDNDALPIGIGTPGSISRTSPLMRNANTTCLNGKPLHRDLEERLKRPVRMANDADCFTLSEAVDGAAAGAQTVFGVILGTGVGGGICIDGKLLNGINGIAGEWGHNYLRLEGQASCHRECFCGRLDCNESWLSGPGLARSYRERTGLDLPAREIVTQAGKGDEAADRVLSDYYVLLSRALASVINIIDPDVIVFGGGLSNIPGLCHRLSELLPGEVFSDSVATRLVTARHGDSSGVRGAAWLWT